MRKTLPPWVVTVTVTRGKENGERPMLLTMQRYLAPRIVLKMPPIRQATTRPFADKLVNTLWHVVGILTDNPVCISYRRRKLPERRERRKEHE